MKKPLLYAVIQLENKKVVTKYISEINFVSSAKQGDIIEIGIEVSAFGSTSLTLKCAVRNKMTHHTHHHGRQNCNGQSWRRRKSCTTRKNTG